MTQDVLGELFVKFEPLANRWIHLLLPILNTALAELEEMPSRATDPASMCNACEASNQSQEGEHLSVPCISEIKTPSCNKKSPNEGVHTKAARSRRLQI